MELENRIVLAIIVGMIVCLGAGFYIGYHTGITGADNDCVSLVNGVTLIPNEDGKFSVMMNHELSSGEQRIVDKLRGE